MPPSTFEANPLLLFEQRNVSDEGVLFPILDKNKIQKQNRNGNLLYKMPYKTAFFQGLKFTIWETGRITMEGSLHKYWNNGAHNYNDFDIKAILTVLQDLKIKFGITPGQSILKRLEIGVNINPPIPTNEILSKCLLHKNKPFEDKMNSDEGRYKQVEHSQYMLKTYNKAQHYISKGFEIDGEIMRFEINFIKMEKLKQKNIYNLEDLLNFGLQNFKQDLVNEWQNVLFFDNTIQIDSLDIKLGIKLLKYSNVEYWLQLLFNNQKKNFIYHKNQLRKITADHSENLQNEITKIIEKKIDLLNI
ncbi:hypothetical protein [Flavobacterium sp. 245]|uniref:hypothetical protein n=1 Tax=Flavobacterium sp. 245 TaxID=2512115 RepID=UPI00105D6217|nr:hypothetical protein [Flavobacterium sp. 245]TDP04076.1 hypothetical protein EV145_101477 [Flavobacterium sp. 245]